MDTRVTTGFFTLAEARAGTRVRIAFLRSGRRLASRLADMGLLEGVKIEVLQSTLDGPVVVARGDGRLALGKGMTEKIVVSAVEADGEQDEREKAMEMKGKKPWR